MSFQSSKAWPAPAKLNLFLHITSRRADGYHLLQTVFQFINYCDWLYFTPRDDGVIQRLSELPGVAPEHDLTVRAARLLQDCATSAVHGCTSAARGRMPQAAMHGVDIRIDKRLPMGGGLGGGSSDAATTLVALNQLWGLHLPIERLAALGLQLGADVPVFIQGHAAWAEGVGEIMTPITLPEPWYVVIAPPCQVPTREIFSAPELTRDAPTLTIEGFLSPGRMLKCGERRDAQEPPAVGLGSIEKGGGWGGSNVCEPVVSQRYPPVATALAWLRKQPGAIGTRMTGTGACVFAAFADESSARQTLQRIPANMQGFVARGMNRSPLYDE